MTIQQLSGIFALLNYTASIFQLAGSNLTIIESSIVIGFVMLVANTTTFFVIQKVGSKVIESILNGN